MYEGILHREKTTTYICYCKKNYSNDLNKRLKNVLIIEHLIISFQLCERKNMKTKVVERNLKTLFIYFLTLAFENIVKK